MATLLVLCLAGVTVVAQTSNGTIVGVVTDPQGAVVQNATVIATNASTGEVRHETTNSLGAYRFESVLPGPYTITVEAKNFAQLKIQNVLVTASVTTTVNGTLAIGKVEEVVTVEGIGKELQTESGQITHNISTVEVSQLVVPTLNPIQLVLTEPGVSNPNAYGFSNGFNFAVNGARPRANNFLIEGSDNNDAAIQGQAFQVTNLEATKEVTILTNSYGAEFGHGGGSVTNLIYKSGTNTWHGSVYDLIQNSSLNSNSAENKVNGTAKEISRENTYGFTLGGPLKHDRVFFFGSVQWDPFRSTAPLAQLTIPDANGIAVLQSLSANPRVAEYLQALGPLVATSKTGRPIPLGSGRPIVTVGNFQRIVGNPSNDTQYVFKGDWLPTGNDTVSLRYAYDTNNLTPDTLNLPRQLQGFDTQQGGSSHNAGITYTRVFSPKVVNEFRVSFSRIGFAFTDTPATAANPLANGPTISISGLSGFGAPGGIPQSRAHDTYQYQDSVSWSKGNHTFKFGADLAQIRVVDQIPFNSFGSITYASGGGFSALANFIDDFSGAGGSISRAFGSPVTRPHYFYQNYFTQDEWKMRSNLTVTLGIRYEYGGTPENNLAFPALPLVQGTALNNVTSLTFVPQQPDKNNWAPRVSLAYSPHFWESIFGRDKTVIRAGFGMFYDSFFTNIIDNSAASSPNVVSPSLTGVRSQNAGRGLAAASTQFAALNPIPNPRVGVTTIADNLVAPLTYQWNFDIQRELGAQFTVTASYVGTRGEHLFANDQLNPVDPNSPTGLRLNPNLGSIQVRDNSGDSIYHGLDLKLDRRFSNGLLLRGAYTFSKLIDNASEVFVTTGQSSFPADLTLGNRRIDRGLSAYDHRHVASATFVYDIPKVRNENSLTRVLGYLTNGWQTSGTYFFQTGNPNTVTDGFDANGDGQTNDRPNLANPNAPLLAWAIDASQLGGTPGTLCDGPTAVNTGTCSSTINGTSTPVTAQNVHWIVPANGVGNLGRNTFITQHRQDTTFGLERTFNLHGDRHKLAFRTEMINPFNHPNTGFNGGPPLSLTAISLIPASGSAPIQTFANFPLTAFGQRIIRFKLRYSF